MMDAASLAVTVEKAPAPPPKINPAIPPLERATDAALIDHGTSLIGWLKTRRWVMHSDQAILDWLRRVTLSNEYFFIHRGPCFALAHRVQYPLEPLFVRVAFCLGPRELASICGGELVGDVHRWAVAQGASKVVIDEEMSNVPRKAIVERGMPLYDQGEIFMLAAPREKERKRA